MKRTTFGVLLGSLLVTGTAAAAEPPPPGFAELSTLFNPTMRCNMKWSAGFFGPDAAATTTTATIAFKQLSPVLFSIHFVQGKPGGPTSLDLWEFFSHDGERFDRVLYGAGPGSWHGTAQQWEGAELRFVSDHTAQCEKKEQSGALTITRRGTKEFGFQVQRAGPDGTWIELGSGACK